MLTRSASEDGDVVVRQEKREGKRVYVLHAASAPDQFLLRTFDEAVAQALAFAKRQHVRAWFTNDEDDFVPLGTFRTMATRTYASGNRPFEITLSGTPAASYSSWTVEHVYDGSVRAEISLPGMDSIVASTEDAAIARACDLIDKWLRYRVPSQPMTRLSPDEKRGVRDGKITDEKARGRGPITGYESAF